jgi:hypothetical protein
LPGPGPGWEFFVTPFRNRAKSSVSESTPQYRAVATLYKASLVRSALHTVRKRATHVACMAGSRRSGKFAQS